MSRIPRPLLLAVSLTMLVAACTRSGPPLSDAGGETTTTVSTPPTTGSSTTVPSATTTIPAEPEIVPPELADPFDLAEEALAPVPGYEPVSSDEFPLQLDRLDMVLNAYSLAEALVWDVLENDFGEEVFVASLYPYGVARGDPTLPPFVAQLLAAFNEEPEQIPIEHGFVFASEGFDTGWMAWGSNTVVIVAAGPREATLEVLEALAAANQDEYRWQPGDCLWLGNDELLDGAPFAPFGRGPIVPCDGWHTHEVIGSSAVADGPEAPYPGDAIQVDAWETCEQRFVEFIGISEQDSSVGLIRYLPSDLEWEEGDRYTACVVTEYDASGAPAPRRDSLAGIGEESRLERNAGDCRRGSYVSEPISCEAPHDSEYLGTVEFSEEQDAAYPWYTLYEDADSLCRDLLDDYAADGPVGAALDATGLPPGPYAWSQGDRRVACIGFAIDNAGFPQLVLGSMAEDGWRIIGPSGDDVTA